MNLGNDLQTSVHLCRSVFIGGSVFIGLLDSTL